jgi:benzoyl-CoA reductase/2-hydroxyglutaryl-CoA dehydratase subunit BcrC/BadD/HgdB
MNEAPAKITLDDWDLRYRALRDEGLDERWYGGPLARHVLDGDHRLEALAFDNSAAALRLWNFVLTEEDRLHEARAEGKTIVGAMKDLGSVPVLATAAPELVCFYPDGAWWTPCIMAGSDGLLAAADRLGVDDTFCPVRAMLGAFEAGDRFPIPDFLTCSVGATCDDFSAIAQRLEHCGHAILWWELLHRRTPEPDEESVALPDGQAAPRGQVEFVRGELARVHEALEQLAGHAITEEDISASIVAANAVRRRVGELRRLVYRGPARALPALEMLLVEVLPIHFCSDRAETLSILDDLLTEVWRRTAAGAAPGAADAARMYWVNPVADLRVMNLIEDCGGRICGSDYMFAHARFLIPVDIAPLEALARIALSDPMAGSAHARARAIVRELEESACEAVIISRIPGASHCATEGTVIAGAIQRRFPDMPVLEIEVSSLSDAYLPSLCTRLEALIETVKGKRRHGSCRH